MRFEIVFAFTFPSHSRKLLLLKLNIHVNFLQKVKIAKLKSAKFRDFLVSRKFLPAKVFALKVILQKKKRKKKGAKCKNKKAQKENKRIDVFVFPSNQLKINNNTSNF